MNKIYTGGAPSSQLRGLLKQRNLTRTVFGVLMMLFSVASLHAQTITNYAVSRATNSSFLDMSSGTTTILAPLAGGYDSGATPLQNLPFDFWFMGVRYTQASFNVNGGWALGSTTVATGTASLVTTANRAIFGVINGDNSVLASTAQADAGIYSKVFGTAPNRTYVVEVRGHIVPWDTRTTGGNTSNYQVWLEETTNKIYYVYGSVVHRTTSIRESQVFISDGNGSVARPLYLTATAPTAPATIVTSTTAPSGTARIVSTGTANAPLPIINGGASNGSRVLLTFDPTAAATPVAAPTGLTVSGAGSLNLSWTDASNESGYEVYYSTSGADFAIDPSTTNTAIYGRVSVAANATSTSIAGLTIGSTYFVKLFSRREGLSTAVTGSATVTAVPVAPASVAVVQGGSGNIAVGSNNVPLLRLDVTASGNAGTFSLSSLALTLASSTNSSSVGNVRIYRTTTTTFATTNQLGTGTINWTGSNLTVNLANAGTGFDFAFGGGTNYIWVAANITSGATAGTNLDLAVTGNVTFNLSAGGSTNLTPSTPDPTGTYTIFTPIGSYNASRTTGGYFAPVTSNLATYQSGTLLDDAPGALTTFPASFTFSMGGTTYTQFSATSNGQVTLGSPVIGSQASSPLASQPVLCAISGDNAIISNASLPSAASRTFISGTAPNRIFVIEYSGFAIPYNDYASTTLALATAFPSSYQVQLEETTNIVRFVYGPILDRSIVSTTRNAFISNGAASATNSIYIDGTTGLPVATGTASPITEGGTTAGTAFPFISGGSDGSRIIYSFSPNGAPATVTAPGSFTSPSQTTTSINLTWTDATNENQYILWYSNTNASFDVNTVPTTNTAAGGRFILGANTTSQTVTGLSGTTPYFFKLVALKGTASSVVSTSASLLPEDVSVTAVAVSQATSTNALRNQTNVPVLQLTITTSGNANTYSVDYINLSNISSGISGIRVFRTSTPTFSAASQLGTGSISVSGSTLTIDAASAGAGFTTGISGGTTYLWITADISSSATFGSAIDFAVSGGDIQFATTGGAVNIAPTTPNPAGANTVIPQISDYTAARAINSAFAPQTTTPVVIHDAEIDDANSTIQTIPFTFTYAGTDYTSFFVNSNGQISLGSTAVSANIGAPASGTAVLAPITGDNETGFSPSNLRSYVSGTAPNRIFVIDFNGFKIDYTMTNPLHQSSFQVWLEETTNAVRYVYGPVINGTAPARTVNAFISNGVASANNSIYINGTTGLPVATATAPGITESTGITGTSFPFISGGADGSRVVYTFSPNALPSVSTPTGLTSTAQTTGSISLAWSDVSDEHGYILWYSNSSASFNENAITANTGLEGKVYLAANTSAYEVTGLTSNTPYYFKLVAVKGTTSGFATLTQSVLALPVAVSSVAVSQAGTGLIARGGTNLPLLQFTVSTVGNFNTYNLQSITLGLGSGVTAGTITGVRIFRTTTPVFSTANQVGTGAISFSGTSLTITSSNAGAGFATTYSAGTNYFWIAGNISGSATILSTADLQVTGDILFTYGSTAGNAVTPTTPNPTGSYTIGNAFDFESGDQGFANASSNTSSWTRTTMPASGTTPNSLNASFSTTSDAYPGYRTGNSGTQVWGTNAFNTPASSSVALGNQDLTSPIFVAQGTSTNFSLWNWWSLDAPTFAFDEVIFEYSVNGGAWTSASTNANGPNRNTPTAGWKQRTISVPTTAGQTVQLRFRYEGDGTVLAGYFFDDFLSDAPLLTDVTAPTISLGSVTNTPSRVNYTLTGLATIVDPSPGFGVNTSTTLRPRLYFKRSTDANSSTGWKSVAATNTTSPFSFVVDYSLLNGGTGVNTGDVVQYFVVAQDNATVPNVGVNSGVTLAGTRTSVNLSTTNLSNVSGTIPSYTIIPGPLTLDAVAMVHPNATATRGSTNQVIGRIELQIGGSTGSLNLTSLVVNSNSGNITTTNVGNFKLFYTTGTTFATTTQLGSAVAISGTGTAATITFSGLNRALSGGSNYIWVTSDIPAGATISTTLALQQAINSITVNNGTSNVTAPASAVVPTGTVTVTLPVLPNLAYTVARSTGIQYSSIVGLDGTSTFAFTAGSSRDDAVSPAVNVSSVFGGFLFQGEAITSIAASTNGHLQFNNDFGLTNTYQNGVAAFDIGAIRKSFAPFYDDLYCSTTDPNNHMFWRVDGNPGNRILTAEWISMEQFLHAGPDLNFQVKLYEADDRIEFVYGTMVGFNGSVDKAYDYTLGIFGGVTSTSQTTLTPLAGQYLSQRFENTNNFQNATYTPTLASIPACNSRITFTPSGSFTNGTATAPVVSNNFCGASTPIGLTFGASIDNCNVYKTALYSGSGTTPATCTTGVANGADDAAWFSFVNDSPRDVVVLVNASGGFAPAIQLASSCSNALACTTTTTAGGIMQLTYPSLGVGTFYVRVHHNGVGISGTPVNGGLGTGNFTLSVYTTVSAPANDICSGALTLTPNASETLGSTLNASSQATSPAGVGSGVDPDDDDVWYQFTATSTSATILSRGVSPFIPVVEVWRTACPNNTTATTERILQSNPNLATQQSNLLTGLIIGTTYYIRVYHRATGAPASGSRQFYLQVSLPRPACPTLITAAAPSGGIATPASGATGVSFDVPTAFEWNPVTFDGTISYRYYFGTSATPADNAFTTTSSTSFTTPNLADGATYYFQVRTVSSTNGESQGCVNRSFSTAIRPGVPVCAVVSSPVANAVTTTSPTITWASVANTFRYTVQIATDAGFSSVVYNNINVSSTATSLTIPAGNLLGNTTYFVRVTPRNALSVAPSVTCNAVIFRTEVANNNSAGAIALTFGTSCSPVSATSIGASASTATNGVGVTGANDDDVWFSFVPTTQNVTISVTGGTTAGTLQNPVIELALGNGVTFATYDGSTGATEIASGNVPFVDGRMYLARVYSRSANSSNAGTFNICVIGASALTGNNTISGNYGSVNVSSGNTLTINGATTVGNLTVETGGTLIVQGSNVVSGNTFTLAAGATLQIASPAGITSGSSATGNIQFAVRNFSNDANYVYNGSAAQATGTGLPSRVRNLTINNSNGVTLTSNTSVAEVLNITAGTFACGSNNFTFLSSPTVTARLAELSGGAAITGTNFTVERNAGAYNTSATTATGVYYFLGTPVTGATLTDWSVSGRFNQVFTGLTRSTYTYDATAGWASGAENTAMNPGTGAQIWADQSLQRNNIPFAINGNGIATNNVDISDNAANTTTFKLVANPYPSSIDFGSVRTASTNIDNSFWVWSHVNRSYVVVTNGNSSIPVGNGGLTNVLASSQGFLVKATAAGAYSVNFREAHKTTASNTALGRTAVNPTIRMSLRGGNNSTSFAAIFFQANATRNFDADFDGRLLPSTVNISTWSADSQRLVNNTLPTPAATDSVGINIAASLAGTYTLSFIELSNLPAGMRVFLKDRSNGSLSEVTEGFTFDVTLGANANTDRFVLVYTPANINSVSNNLGKELVSLFPNPSNSGNFTVRTSGFNAEYATVIITDAVGKTVHTQTIEVGLTPINNTVNASLAAGVYNVTCTSGTARVTTKLVVNK